MNHDFGFLFTHNLSSFKHIKKSAVQILGFVLRSSTEFHLLSALKVLYSALEVEYGSILWDSSTANASAIVGRIQRKFIRIVAYILKILHPFHDYTPVQHILYIATLAAHSHILNLSYLTNFTTTKIDFPTIINIILLIIN